MSSRVEHAEIKDLIPLKALSQLDGDEARAVDEHLAAGCDECERELASFNDALAEKIDRRVNPLVVVASRQCLVQRSQPQSSRSSSATRF